MEVYLKIILLESTANFIIAKDNLLGQCPTAARISLRGNWSHSRNMDSFSNTHTLIMVTRYLLIYMGVSNRVRDVV